MDWQWIIYLKLIVKFVQKRCKILGTPYMLYYIILLYIYASTRVISIAELIDFRSRCSLVLSCLAISVLTNYRVYVIIIVKCATLRRKNCYCSNNIAIVLFECWFLLKFYFFPRIFIKQFRKYDNIGDLLLRRYSGKRRIAVFYLENQLQIATRL